MTDIGAVTAWIRRYRIAWETNDPGDIGDLFAETAVYLTEPFATPWTGREQIVARWLEHRDAPGETTFEWRPLAVTDDVAIVQGETGYPDRRYSNLWVLRLNETGQCLHFTEWWMQHPTSNG